MPGLYEKLRLAAAVALAVLAVVRSSPVVGPEPIRCAPCTQEKLNECPAIPADCRQVLREPGCGCCMACALEKGASCGVHTAHCGEGLRCTPKPGEARPLHALTRGQGVCTENQGQGMFTTNAFSSFSTYLLSSKSSSIYETFILPLQTKLMEFLTTAPCISSWVSTVP